MLDTIFNYTKYLERRKMIGQLHPWNRFDQSKPIIGLLVPLEIAINECVHWSGQEITRSEFLRYLTDNGVHAFNTIDDFCKEKARNRETTPRKTKRLLEIVGELNVSKERIKYSEGFNRFLIAGKSGYVHDDESNPSLMRVYVSGRSKRHWSSIKRKLSFMKLLKDEGKGGHFSFDTMPDNQQASAIRNMVGLSRCHTITPEHKEALRNHAAAIRENIGATSLQVA
jgi:hypothetical protein